MLERASELLEWTMVEPPRNEGTEWQLRQQDADDRAQNVWRGVVGELATRIEGGSSDIVPGRYSRRREDGGRNKETTKDAIRSDTQINMRTDHVTVPYQATSTIAATNHYNRPPYEEDSNLNEDNEDKEDLDDTEIREAGSNMGIQLGTSCWNPASIYLEPGTITDGSHVAAPGCPRRCESSFFQATPPEIDSERPSTF
ncbi:hypothetical protein K438DRAFT_1940528 [Mycena galopus ATCC 62051]|nr:hypothetical protein K438DRAFT_1940528 [Mycena galopus ATCC 62051]